MIDPTKWYDWCELLECFGRNLESFDSDSSDVFKDEHDAATFLRDHINRIYRQLGTSKDPLNEQDIQFIAASRQLVTNVGEGIHESAPLFAGMAKIKSDTSFLKYLNVLLEHIWD